MVTFKYHDKIMQDSYDISSTQMLERAESEESKKKEIPVSVTINQGNISYLRMLLKREPLAGEELENINATVALLTPKTPTHSTLWQRTLLIRRNITYHPLT